MKIEDNVTINGECYNMFAHTVVKDFEHLCQMHLEADNYRATITSANDGSHSENSLHYKNMAIDVRLKDLPIGMQDSFKYLEGIVCDLGLIYPECVFILHLYDNKNHIHMQYGRDNIISFDSAIGENNNVFIK